jgi:hypothetical protein
MKWEFLQLQELRKVEKMHRLSSNWTLFLKIFLPVFWLSFLGGFLAAAFVSNSIEFPHITSMKFRIEILLIFVSGIIFFIFTFFRLKRIDAENEFIYVTNYFKTYRYHIENIAEIKVYNHIILKAAHLKFTSKSSFGKKIIFLPNSEDLMEFCDANKVTLIIV